MTSRERVLAALDHREPDRIPIDLGGTIMTGIMAQALTGLRRHLGLEERPVKVYEIFQMLGEVEADLVDAVGIDVLPVEPIAQFFGLRREHYKPWRLFDGTEVLVPGQFDVVVDDAGNWLLHHEGDASQPLEGRMPKDGYYFDMAAITDTHLDFTPPPLEEVGRANHLTTAELEHLQQRAEHLRRTTDKALLLGSWGKLGLPGVGSFPDFLCLMATDRAYVKDLFDVRTETALENLQRLADALGDTIDIVGLDGTDYGSQKAECFSPDWFAELYLPGFRAQNDWVHANTSWKTWQHSCGSIPRIIPHLVESGLDILNPVQCSATGMDPAWLKRTFGNRLTFWGGCVDTQHTLPFGSPEDVRREVAERIRIFGQGGGFVLNPIHNIQHGTPPENIVAMFEAAHDVGCYPIAPAAGP